jgi:predicted nuclease with RNAse H fold
MVIGTDATRTVGVDLSAEPARTAICAVTWTPGAATVEPPIRKGYDDAILAACASANRIGIDCPFSWPDSFVEAVSAHRAGQPWPGRHRDSQDYRHELRYRATDCHVRDITGRWPLSVSTDRIGVTAMRCASLLDSLATQGTPVDRAGSGRVVEVYPATALHVWHLLRPAYKRDRNVLDAMVTELLARLPNLHFPAGDEQFRRNDHVFDALICALVARAAQLGATTLPQTVDQQRQATSEGWIHLPDGGLESLA